MSDFTKLVDRFFASTVAPATLPPFSSRTSPWTVPAEICDCPHPDKASPSASVKTKNAHNSFLIFSPPDITTRLRTSHELPQKVEAARRTDAAGEFMPGRSKSTRVVPVETFPASNQILNAIHRNTAMHPGMLEDGECDGGRHPGLWKQFSIRSAS